MFNPYTSPYMQQPFPQQYTPTPTPTPQATQPNTPTVLYASTARDFANVTIQPGRQALIIAQNEPFMAFKSADMMGMVQTSMYRIEPVSEDELNAPAPEYATKSELAQLQQIVQQIADSMNKPTRQKKETVTE